MAVGVQHLVGREEELAALFDLLDTPDELPGFAAVVGAAGIGKTTLWLAAAEAAEARGYLVLFCRSSEAEARFSFVGMTDLIGGVVPDVLPELPRPQRRALEAALSISEVEGSLAEEGVVALAFLNTLRKLAATNRLLLALDDVQWLDAPSLAMVRFALPRLEAEPVAAILTARDEAPLWLRRGVPEARLRTIELGPFSVGALGELLRTRAGVVLPRPTLLRIWETSGGNPFFALELAGALHRHGRSPSPDEPLPIPSSLEQLLHERLKALTPEALAVAHVVAAVSDPSVELVEATLERRADNELVVLLDARILELDGGRLRFTHPLLASAVGADPIPSRRRVLHERLSEVAPTAEERARHLALATVRPSARIAAVLEDAARSIHERGAPSEAAELAEQALRLTPSTDADDARRRLVFAAARHNASGDADRAVALLESARAEAPAGPGRAAILVELAMVKSERPREAEALFVEALAETEGDATLEATIYLALAELMRWSAGIERGVAYADRALRAALRSTDVELRARALTSQACWECRAGRGLGQTQLAEALALERTLPDWPLDHGPAQLIALELMWTLELERARELLLELLDTPRAQGDAGTDGFTRWTLAMVEWRAGRWDEAERQAAHAREIATQLGRAATEDIPTVFLAAHRGHVDAVRRIAGSAVERAKETRVQIEESGHGWILGFLELSLGDAAAALPHLVRSHEIRDVFMLEPGMRLELGDLVEAQIAAGELDAADQVLAEWEPRAAAVDRAWALALVARGRGLLLAARGDLDGAFAAFDRALAEHDRDVDPFQQARTLLALGRTQRRAKQRAAARATLEDALARFESLGASLWAEQTRGELARIGGRAPSRGELTEAERRIAGLVAEGHTNRQVAAALYLTEHSVETALTRIYRKLGVRSRGELAHLHSTSG